MADAPASPGGGGGSHESGSPRGGGGGGGGGVREQDRFLPIANISRITKKAIPANGKIAKDAKETVQECVSEFISFITSEASDKCQREKRKTINGDDLLWAMATLGFEDYIEPLKVYLQKYREMEGDSKLTAKAGDGSIKKDALGHGGASSSATQGMGQQGVYNQAMGYMQPQLLLPELFTKTPCGEQSKSSNQPPQQVHFYQAELRRQLDRCKSLPWE